MGLECAQVYGSLCFVDTWENRHVAQIGAAVQRRRKALKLSAQQLSALTDQLGLKLTRQSITDMENGRRRYVTTAELAILAVALKIPPILLLFPGFPDGLVEVVPGTETRSEDAASWFSGTWPGPSPGSPGNQGLLLVKATRALHHAEFDRLAAQTGGTAEAAVKAEDLFQLAEAQIKSTKAKLWGDDDA